MTMHPLSGTNFMSPLQGLGARVGTVQGLRPWLSHFAPLGLTATRARCLRYEGF